MYDQKEIIPVIWLLISCLSMLARVHVIFINFFFISYSSFGFHFMIIFI